MRNNKRVDDFFIHLKKSHNGYIQEGTVFFVVVLACPSRDPIQAPQRTTPSIVAHVQHTNDSSSSSVQRDMVDGE
jgi:hypothetical protein